MYVQFMCLIAVEIPLLILLSIIEPPNDQKSNLNILLFLLFTYFKY